jgi:ribosome biogenesis GTPase A
MAKASKEIEETKPLDLIIEIVDARAIKNTRNDELSKNINKPKIIIALKKDLSDIRITENTNIHITCINDNTFKNTILKILNSFFSEKIQKLKSKGLLMPQFYIMVIGLPNVGKSSFINKLTNFQTKVNVQNKPGVTRKKQMIKISDNFFIYDTPGIMIKKIRSNEQGYILSLLNIIKRENIPVEEVAK